MYKLNLTFLTLLFITIGATAQQAKSKSKPVRQVTENTLPAPKTEQVSPPVKGVGTVVKRNPGSGASKISGTTNAQGETTVAITEKGNYVITVLQPTPTGTAMTETNGGPVKGVKMGLGKNPSGLLVSSQPVNDKGEVEFKDLEPGSYTIKIISNEVNCPPGFIMNNGVCEPLPKVATDQPVKAATNIRPELVNPRETPAPAAIAEQLVANTCKSNVRQHNIRVTPITNNGEVTLEVTEAGDYMLFLTRKDEGGQPGAKSFPIKRPVYCKNPPCPTSALQVAEVNEQGEVLFQQLTPGTYKVYLTFDPQEVETFLQNKDKN